MDYSRDEYFTFEKIRQRIIDEYQLETNKVEGGFGVDVANAVAVELAIVHQLLEEDLKFSFPQDSSEEYLEMLTEAEGVTKKAATYAEGTVKVLGKDGTIVVQGTMFANDTTVYETTEDVIIENGEAIVIVKSSEIGDAGNTLAGTIINIPVSVEGVTSVSNQDKISNGANEEDDDSLRERYFEQVQIPAASGNKQNYKNWAKEVEGVGRAEVYPLYYGLSTVRVIITNSEFQEADTTLVEKTSAYIEERRPVKANATVESAKSKQMTIDVKVNLTEGKSLESVTSLFKEALIQYFKDLSLRLFIVSYAKIGSLLFSISGIEDYSDLEINGLKENVTLADDEIPILLSVNVSEG